MNIRFELVERDRGKERKFVQFCGKEKKSVETEVTDGYLVSSRVFKLMIVIYG